MRFALRLCLMLPWTILAQTSGSTGDWRDILRQARHKVVEAIGESDNYICQQDLSRFYYETQTAGEACRQPVEVPNTPLRANDRLKLDVAVSQGLEIYSWHGEHKFTASDVGQLVRKGPISSGSFSGYLRNIFAESGIRFAYTGKAKQNEVDVYRFDYDVPQELSHYRVQAGRAMVTVPFHGSFAVRAEDLELYSLVVTARGDGLTKKSEVCAIQSSVIYQRVPIGNHESLLPKSFDLLMGTRQGQVTQSKGEYSECRAYTGESTVHFDDASISTNDTAPAMADAEPLRPGIVLQVALKGSIDEDTAYAGEPVEAVLTHNTKLGKGKTLERGATLRGTITHFEIFDGEPHHVTVMLQFSSIVEGKNLYLCKAVHQILVRPAGYRNGILQHEQEDADDGSIVFYKPHVRLDQNFKSVFVTVDQAETEPR